MPALPGQQVAAVHFSRLLHRSFCPRQEFSVVLPPPTLSPPLLISLLLSTPLSSLLSSLSPLLALLLCSLLSSVHSSLVRTRCEFQSPWLELVSPCHSSWRDDLHINPHRPGIPSDDRHESHPTLCSSTAISARQAPLVATALVATALGLRLSHGPLPLFLLGVRVDDRTEAHHGRGRDV